ncbi:hypothetical protein GOV13_01540 [Candidatus Pacearchaeota archaeon]|nr:hypothetical protein [Candidatus Pacearchaeota archaeon]
MVFSEKHRDYTITELYDIENPNAAKAARIFNEKGFSNEGGRITITRQIILEWWKEEGLRTTALGKGDSHGVSERAFKEVYKRHEGNTKEMRTDFKKLGFKIKEISIKRRCWMYRLDYVRNKNQKNSIDKSVKEESERISYQNKED